MVKAFLILVLAFAFSAAQAQAPGQCPVHVLSISEIRTIQPASGLDAVGEFLVEQLIETVLFAPVGVAAGAIGGVAKASRATVFVAEKAVNQGLGSEFAFGGLIADVRDLFDAAFSAQDDLVVRVNGVRVVPRPGQTVEHSPEITQQQVINPDLGAVTADYRPMFPDSRLSPNVQISFVDRATLRLIEYDSGSPNDNLGALVFRDESNLAGAIEPVNVHTLLIEAHSEEGSIYEVSAEVLPFEGVLDEIPERLICDEEQCVDALGPVDGGWRGIFKTFEGELMPCPAGYNPAGAGGFARGDFQIYGELNRICELYPRPNCGAEFLPLSDISALNDGDIVVLEGLTAVENQGEYFNEYLSARTGQYLARCNGCVPGAGPVDNAVVHVIDPKRTAAQWVVNKQPNGKFALRSETGKYLARCQGCIPGSGGDSAFIHVSDPLLDVAQFTIEPAAGAGKYTLQSDNNKYLSPCLGCVPDQKLPGLRHNGHFQPLSPDSAFAAWEVSVKQPETINLTTEGRLLEDYVLGVDTFIAKQDDWVVPSGSTFTIETGVTLTITNGASLTVQNGGELVNKGTIRVDLGKIDNQGIVVNNQIIRLINGVITNRAGGVINNTAAGNFFNLRGLIVNDGDIYDPYDKFTGTDPTSNAITTGFFMAPGESGKRACGDLGGRNVDWDSPVCTSDHFFVKDSQSLTIAAGATLVIQGTFENSGSVLNNGTIDDTNGSVLQCGFFDPNGNLPTSGVLLSCDSTPDSDQCDRVGGSYTLSTNTCTLTPGSTLPVPLGSLPVTIGRNGGPDVTWNVNSWLENYGIINIGTNGTVVVKNLISNYRDEVSGYGRDATINNRGVLTIIIDGESGIPGRIENEGVINNFGTLNNGGDIVGGNGTVENKCGSIFNLVRDGASPWRSPFDAEGEFHQIFFDCRPLDSDNDGVNDDEDACPFDANETVDTDDDSYCDGEDDFPNDPLETTDSDMDGVGDNADAFPNDPTRTTDSDSDGVDDQADLFPNDPYETADRDMDGVGDNGDAFPDDILESSDTDLDGIGDNGDAFPNDPDDFRLLAASSNNGWTLAFGRFSNAPAPAELPEWLTLTANGLVDVRLSEGDMGSAAVITLTYADPIDTELVWWSYGPTPSNATPHWYLFGSAEIAGNTVTLTIADGIAGDDDLSQNAAISTMGGLGQGLPPIIFLNGFED